MDFDNPAVMFSGMVIATLGMGMFIYGKKTPSLRFILGGGFLSVVPFFAHTLLVLWGLSSLCGAALYATRHYE